MKLALVFVLLVVHSAEAQPMRRQPDPAVTYAVAVDGHPGDGPADAKVTMVVVHDYTDPYSERNRATLVELRKKYQRDLRIVFRNMVVHPRNAMAAALASCAAHKQKKFDQMEEKLWDGFRARQWDMTDVELGNGPQKCWDTVDGCAHVTAWAKDIGLDMRRFRSDMKSCEQVIADDMRELGGDLAVQATPTFFINGRHLAGALPTEAYVKLIDEELARADEQIKKGVPKNRYYRTWVVDAGVKQVPSVAAPPSRPTLNRSTSYAIKVDGHPSKGPADAPVTLVMFFDYATPYAEKARATLEDLVQRYGKSLRIVYRTRLVHPSNAMASALAMCAADKQKRFAAMDAVIWEKGFKARQLDPTEIDLGNGPQKCWDTPDSCKHVVDHAIEIGLDVARFKRDLKSCVKPVTEDDADATTFNVNATPTFFVNGRPLSGAQPVEVFVGVIDEELEKASERIKKGTPKARYYKSWIVDRGEKTIAP